MPRHSQPLEDKLRAYVRKEVIRREALQIATGLREDRPGERAHLSKFLRKPTNFVSRYLDGRTHANLDTTKRLMEYFDLSWAQVSGQVPYPSAIHSVPLKRRRG